MVTSASWHPPDFNNPNSGVLEEITALFKDIYDSHNYGDLAENISRYWISRLGDVWAGKSQKIKTKDLAYNPDDPLSRIEQKAVLITYADSVRKKGEPSLKTLEKFLASYFPAIRGMHMLPACVISQERFNDGGFSQIKRNAVHPPYGTNAQFEHLMVSYYAMADFVLNHVDIENPVFQKYLNGDDGAGDCFFVFSEKEYKKRLNQGDFRNIFRPRPFPLFTLFRRKPKGAVSEKFNEQKVAILNQQFHNKGLTPLPDEFIHLLSIFSMIKNDQMLLEGDYQYIIRFQDFLSQNSPTLLRDLFILSQTQETRTPPYIFTGAITCPEDLLAEILPVIRIPAHLAPSYASVYHENDEMLFGEQIRALTTFSHVQVDLNLSTFEGLKLLIDDFSWYLKMDLNMLRLDAANFAFKKWGTSCFGLPEGRKLLKILYLSIDAVSPRIVPNLEVNAPLSNVLRQMADKETPPPMMYDFHLASMLPVVFNSADTRPLQQIRDMITQYDIPHESIRFSLDESHDGKSVNGSGGADSLLTYAQRRSLIEVVKENKGHVKYKSSPKYQYPTLEFKKVCMETGLEITTATGALFRKEEGVDTLYLKDSIKNGRDIARALGVPPERLETDPALNFFTTKILHGKEPYELCVSTRDVMNVLDDPILEVRRYMAFKTLAFAMMGRNVKAIYFNDLMGLGNDHDLVRETGELRNIKRKKADCEALANQLNDPTTVESRIAKLMNNLIALVDYDPSFNPRGDEARVVVNPDHVAVAFILNQYKHHNTLTIVNTSDKKIRITFQPSDFGLDNDGDLIDSLSGRRIKETSKDIVQLDILPFARFWIKNQKVVIPGNLIVDDETSQ